MKTDQNKQFSNNSWHIHGQAGAVRLLQSFVSAAEVVPENLPHAFIFLGPKGVGKFALAQEFARKLITTLDTGSQIFTFDFANTGSVEELRELIKFSSLTATSESAKKIFLLNNFQLASIAAQNTLLKTLEEPTRSSLFILVSDNNSEIPTIMSRCMAIRCYPVRDGVEANKTALEVAYSFPELQSRIENGTQLIQEIETAIESLSNTQAPLLAQLKTLQEWETDDLLLLMQLWVEKLVAKMQSENSLVASIKKIRVAQNASEDLRKNYNTKLILQEFLLQTQKIG